ncbi:MAG: hypothetical protein JWQ49_3103 [Edaphobacter sp.]|nr:hypothetical protein [Edaphobacter sp.]
MNFRDKQIAPPKSWIAFEDLCLALFKGILNDPLAKKHGRTGQAQSGVDVYGRQGGVSSAWTGIQCKGKEQGYGAVATEAEFKAELEKAERFTPTLTRWIFTTTAPSDAKLQQVCRRIADERRSAGKFDVDLLSWDDLQQLIAADSSVLRDFYPEHAFDLSALVQGLEALPERLRSLSTPTDSAPAATPQAIRDQVWTPVSFDEQRDLAPALIGRPLGPADAAACPRIPEVDALLQQLRTGYSARLVGVAGAGKSVCAYQVALELSKEGWNVFRLRDSRRDIPYLASGKAGQRSLYLVDDAHLMPEALLRASEEQTSSSALLLSAHTVSDSAEHIRGAVALDAERAVEAIAKSLRSTRIDETYKLVRAIDNAIGDHAGDERIETRIDHASDKAGYPWQFCFILGGGWRRAQTAADNARQANADIVLACAAINQIASGDARADRSQMTAVLRAEGLELAEINSAIEWLLDQRLLLSANDLRCPHQRFAAVVIKRLLAGQHIETCKLVGRLVGEAITNDAYSLVGIRNILHELAFTIDYRWTWIVPQPALEVVGSRCWSVESPKDRNSACFLLAELARYVSDWEAAVIVPNLTLLAHWVSNPADPSGYGLGHLLNHLRNEAKDTLASLLKLVPPRSMAEAINHVTVEQCHSLAVLLKSFSNQKSRTWAQEVASLLRADRLFALADTWHDIDRVYALSELCHSLEWFDEDLALNLVEHSLPVIKKAMFENPTESFANLDHLLMATLRVWDPLGVFVGKYRPDARRMSLARRICQGFEVKRLARQLSEVSKRDFQRAAHVLAFLHRVSPRKFQAVAGEIDLDRINEAFGDEWQNMKHDAEVLLGVLFTAKSARDQVVKLIDRNVAKIKRFPPRLALMAPETALRYVDGGGTVALVSFDHVDWHLGSVVLTLFAEQRKELFEALVRPCESAVAASLSQAHPSWYGEASDFLMLLKTECPESLQRILTLMDVEKARVGWTACLKDKAGARRTASILVQAAYGRDDSIGELARELRSHFPRASTFSPASSSDERSS